MIFKRVGHGRPCPDHEYADRDWARLPPRQAGLGELVTTRDILHARVLDCED